jgi:hypothetical protein
MRQKPCDRRKKRNVDEIDFEISGDPAITFIYNDLNRDGVITFEEFKRSETVLKGLNTSKQSLEDAFIQLDTNEYLVIQPFEMDSDLPTG